MTQSLWSGFCHLFLSMIMTSAALFAPAQAWAQQSHAETVFNFVFDIDWTLANTTNEKMAEADSNGILRVEGKVYRLSRKAIEVLITLHQTPGVRVSFFSGGEASRNLELLKHVYAEINKRVGHGNFHPHRILNVEHMVPVSNDETLKFHQRRKKDLSLYFDILRTLHADDVSDFLASGQEKNMIWTGKTYNDRAQFELRHLEDPKESAYSAPDKTEWKRDQNKLIRILGLFLESRDRALVRNIPLIDAAQEVLKEEKKGLFDPLVRASKEKLFDPAFCGANF